MLLSTGRTSDGSKSAVTVTCGGTSPTLVIDTVQGDGAATGDNADDDTTTGGSSHPHGKPSALPPPYVTSSQEVWAVKKTGEVSPHDIKIGEHAHLFCSFVSGAFSSATFLYDNLSTCTCSSSSGVWVFSGILRVICTSA